MFYGYFEYLLFLSPALILAAWAQMKVKSSYARAAREPARMSGAQAAREILHGSGLYDVDIEQIPGALSDHYDPRHKVLRLSHDVYHGHSLAAVGIAAHEVGHAIQDARHYLPLVVRNAAVPAANFGSRGSMILLLLGAIVPGLRFLVVVGIALFGAVVFFQLVNLPVEFDASARAKEKLEGMGIVNQHEMPYVRKVLSAAAMTYVAATLQSILTLAYYAMIFLDRRR